MGSLVDLSAGGNIGVGDQDAYASLGYGATLGVNFCHGFNLEFTAEAKAKAGVSTQMFEYIQGVLAVEAGVEAGIKLAAQCSGEVTENIGLIASVQAYLKAYVRARLELGLSPSLILNAVKPKMNELQFEIFEAFINQLEIGVGVQGNMQVALTATAEVTAQARLIPDTKTGQLPGFDFRANAEAAFLFGAGFDFFAKARFKDIKNFFKTSKDAIIHNIEDRVAGSGIMEADDRYLVFSTWRLAMDLIIDGSDPDIGRFEKGVGATLISFTKDFLWGVVVTAFAKAIENQLNDINTWTTDNQNSIANGVQLASQIKGLVTSIPQADTVRDMMSIYDQVVVALENASFPDIEHLKKLGTDIHIQGYLQDVDHRMFWQQLPLYAQEVYKDVTGTTLMKLSSESEAKIYQEHSILHNAILDLLNLQNGPVTVLIDLLHNCGKSFNEFLLLLFGASSPAEKKELQEIAFDLLGDVFRDHIVPELKSKVKNILPTTERKTEYVQVLINDLTTSFSEIFIPLFKVVVINGGKKEDKERLLFMTNRFLMGLLLKNVTAINKFFLENAVSSVDTNVIKMRHKIKSPQFDRFGKEFFIQMEDFINDVNPFPGDVDFDDDMEQSLIDATRDLMEDVLNIAKTSMGSETWTPNRIKTLTGSLENLILEPGGKTIDFSQLTLDDVKKKVDELMRCDFLPEGIKSELKKIMGVLQTIGLAQLKAYVFDLPVALAKYLIKVITILFVELVEEILELLYEFGLAAYDAAKQALEDIKELLEDLEKELIELGKEVALFAKNLYDDAEQAIIDFFNALKLDLDFGDLSWLESVFDVIAGLFGDSKEDDAKEAIDKLKDKAVKNLKQHLSAAKIESQVKRDPLTSIEFTHQILQNVFTSGIKNDLEKIKFKSSRSIDDRVSSAASIAAYKVNDLHDVASNYRAKIFRQELAHSDTTYWNERFLLYESHFTRLTELETSTIKIQSPLPLDMKEKDTPIYGKYVRLEIDFDRLEIQKVLESRYNIDPEQLLYRPNKEITNRELKNDFSRRADKFKLGFLEFHVFVNGKEINLDTVGFDGNRLITTLKKPTIKEGRNELIMCLTPPKSKHQLAVIKSVTFFCDFKERKIPSNGVYINLEKSVIDSMGNDHADAARNSRDDKEKIVITNGIDDLVDLDHWTLEDAWGHKFTFPKDPDLKPGLEREVFIGAAGRPEYEWHETYRNKPIAVLNNKGEMLTLKNRKGKIVSQVFTGNPKLNKNIRFASASKPKPVL